MTDQSKLPPPLRDFAYHARRFADGVKLLGFDDDSDIGVTAAAERLAAGVDALNERLVRPAKPGIDDGVGAIAETIAPVVETFGSLVEGFRGDASSGAAMLPDMDDIAVAIALMGQSDAQLQRLLQIIPEATRNLHSPERAELVECLSSAGVPVTTVGLHGPTVIKIIILIVVIVVFLRRGDTKALVITIINILVVIDRRGQGGFKLPPPPPPPPADPCKAKGEFDLIVGGSGATEAQALVDAARNALDRAAARCGAGCRPRFVRLTEEFARTDGPPVRVARRFIFRCV